MAGGEIDRLEIKVASEVGRASKNLDTLVTKLNTLNGSLNQVNGSGLNGLANGVNKLGNAMKNMQSVKTSDFTKLARNIQKLSSINATQLYTTASAMNTIANSLRGLSGISESANSMSEFAKNISKLGNKSVQNAITNMPLLAQGVNDLMSKLSKAPMVSSNLIKMTSALAQLSSQGNRVGSAGRSMSSVLNSYDKQARKSTASSKGLASTIGLLYAKFWILIRAVKALGSAINTSMDFLETVNYFEVAVRNIGQNSASEWKNNGYVDAESYVDSFSGRLKDLSAKMTGFTTDQGGNVSRTGMANLGLDISMVMQNQAMFAQMADSMGLVGEASINTSKALTMLSVDWASLRNVEFSESFNKFSSALAGQSRAVRAYGLDITQANLQEIASQYNINKKVSEMTQSEKAYLRVIALLKQSKVAYGDLANTIEAPANQVRILKQNMTNLARSIGNLFLPILAKVLPYVNAFAMALQRLFAWIGSLLGVDFSSFNSSMGGMTDEVADLVDTTGSETDALNDAAKAAGKLNKQLRAWDELNNLSADSGGGTDTGTSTGGVGGGGALDSALTDALAEYEKKWNEAFSRMDNKAARFADNIVSFFTNMYNAAEPFRKAVINLWDNGLSKLANFTFTALKDFYENLLVPLGKWAFGTEDKGLTRLVNIINNSLMKIDWETINKNLKEFWIAIEPYAEQFGEGLIDFFEDASNIAVDAINKIFGKDGALANLTKTLADGDPQKARDWGYALGALSASILVFKAGSATAVALTSLVASLGSLITMGTITVTIAVGILFAKDVAEWKDFIDKYGWEQGRQKYGEKVKETSNDPMKGNAEAGAKFFEDAWNNAINKIQARFKEPAQDPMKQNAEVTADYFDTKWSETWNNVKTTANTKWNEFLEWWNTSTLVVWWNESVAPWFTIEKWQTLYENFKVALKTTWDNTVAQWVADLQLWWDKDVAPWFTLKKWQDLYEKIKTALKTTWDNTVKQWKTDIKTWWDKDVEPWFTLKKWEELGTNMKDGIYGGFKGVAAKVVDVLNNIISGVESLINKAVGGLNEMIGKANAIPGVSIPIIGEVSLGRIPAPTFQTGGFPEDGLFYANHNELVGKFSNGRTAVANNEQIVSGISSGVASANQNVVNAIVTMTNNIVSAVLSGSVIEIDGQTVFNTVKVQADNYSKMYNEPAF